MAAMALVVALAVVFQNCGRPALLMADLDSQASPSGLDTRPPASATPTSDARSFYPGVNISGGEYSGDKVGAKLFTDYVYPARSQLEYYRAKGMKVVRVPFDLMRLQPQIRGDLDTVEVSRLLTIVNDAKSLGLVVLLDPHNYGSLRDSWGHEVVIGSRAGFEADAFADFWSRMADVFKSKDHVWFGLMNEPYVQSAAEWRQIAEEAVHAIRAAGATNKILVQGTSWTGAHSWLTSGNAAAWADFKDTNFAVEVHQYLDVDSSGTHTNCVAGSAAKLKDVTEWARARQFDLFLGELGWSTEPLCMEEGEKAMAYLASNRDVWLGYAYWAGGAWLGEYMFTIEPNGQDRPQMDVLLRTLPTD